MKIMTPESAHRAMAIGLTLAAYLTGVGPAASVAVAQPFNIDTSSRESVRVFYNTVHQASEGVPMDWTGNIDNCNPGTVSPAYLDAVSLRVNYFRAMAGVPSDVTVTPEHNAKAQAAALMMSANRSLSHDPPPAWSCWTQAGHDGAATSNLSFGNTGPTAISALMYDGSELGHRRNMLDPSILTMGSGSIPNQRPKRTW